MPMLAALVCLPVVAIAADPTWDGKVALGYLATTGNTENSSLNGAFELSRATDKWKHLFFAGAVNASENQVATAEAYNAGYKGEYTFSEHNFLFGRAEWSKDKFSGYDRQVTETVGYGRRLIETEAHRLSAEIGVGARQSTLRDGLSQNETIGRAAVNYKWILNSTAELRQDLSMESGSDNTHFESVSAVKATLVGSLSLVASYTIKKNTDVPIDTVKTDTFTALSLEYRF
jgi:putative salt-induced outer membrane protein